MSEAKQFEEQYLKKDKPDRKGFFAAVLRDDLSMEELDIINALLENTRGDLAELKGEVGRAFEQAIGATVDNGIIGNNARAAFRAYYAKRKAEAAAGTPSAPAPRTDPRVATLWGSDAPIPVLAQRPAYGADESASLTVPPTTDPSPASLTTPGNLGITWFDDARRFAAEANIRNKGLKYRWGLIDPAKYPSINVEGLEAILRHKTTVEIIEIMREHVMTRENDEEAIVTRYGYVRKGRTLGAKPQENTALFLAMRHVCDALSSGRAGAEQAQTERAEWMADRDAVVTLARKSRNSREGFKPSDMSATERERMNARLFGWFREIENSPELSSIAKLRRDSRPVPNTKYVDNHLANGYAYASGMDHAIVQFVGETANSSKEGDITYQITSDTVHVGWKDTDITAAWREQEVRNARELAEFLGNTVRPEILKGPIERTKDIFGTIEGSLAKLRTDKSFPGNASLLARRGNQFGTIESGAKYGTSHMVSSRDGNIVYAITYSGHEFLVERTSNGVVRVIAPGKTGENDMVTLEGFDPDHVGSALLALAKNLPKNAQTGRAPRRKG